MKKVRYCGIFAKFDQLLSLFEEYCAKLSFSVHKDWTAPSLETVLGGDADPEWIVTLEFEIDGKFVVDVSAVIFIGQAKGAEFSFQPATVENLVFNANIVGVARESAVAGLNR